MSKPEKILVLGAAGRFAGLVVPELVERGVPPIGFVRTSEEGDKARKLGAADARIGDLRDKPSLDAALRGIEAVFYISPVFQPDEAEMGADFVERAKDAGVRRIVFSSVMHTSLDLKNHASKRPIENAIVSSGLEFTLLRPAVLFQNLSAMWPKIRDTGKLAEPFSSEARIARVDYRDIAEVAAIALTEDRLLNGSYELSGDRGLNRVEVASIASDAAGRAVEPVAMEFEPWYAEAQLPYDDGQKRQLAAMYAHYDAHGFPGNPLTLQSILGREPRTIQQFFKDLAEGRDTTIQ